MTPRRAQVILSAFLMGVADVIPGVSGGTIAFITGIYDELLGGLSKLNLKNLSLICRGRFQEFSESVNLKFFIYLLTGLVLAWVLAAPLVFRLLHDPQAFPYLFAFFFGVILASSLFLLRKVGPWSGARVLQFLAGLLIAFAICSLPQGKEASYRVEITSGDALPQNASNVKGQFLSGVKGSELALLVARGQVDSQASVLEEQSGQKHALQDLLTSMPLVDPWIVFCGSLAILAMLLPGISGAYILHILGLYGLVLASWTGFLSGLSQGSWNSQAFFFMAQLCVGALLGLGVGSRIISSCLERYPQAMLCLLSGFMLGAVKSVWPFWTYQWILPPAQIDRGLALQLQELQIPEMGWPLASVFGMSLGSFLLVLSLEFLASCKGREKEKSLGTQNLAS